MKTSSHTYILLKYFFIIIFLCNVTPTWAQIDEEKEDNIIIRGAISLKDVDSIMKMYTYDPVTDKYIYTVTNNEFNLEYPMVLTRKQYEEILLNAALREYYSKRLAAAEDRLTEEEKKDLLPGYYVNSKLFETIFGGNTIDVKPSGSVELDLGMRYSKQDNPIISPRNRRTFALDFNQRIDLSLQGKVGTRLNTDINFNNQATMDFQKQMLKLNYEPDEDAILQGIEVGNVSMPVNNSLIRGAQNLFGVKTKLQFGRTTITGVVSKQTSERKTIVAQGGGTVQDFELFALDYEQNRNFFLSQYFRYQYDNALRNYPYIDSRVRITRVEVWVTNRQNRLGQTNNNMRNIIALQDLGEARLSNANTDRIIGIDLNANPTFFGTSQINAPVDNSNNQFNPEAIGTNFLNQGIRQITTAQNGFNIPVTEGRDYVKLENARKLLDNEFKFHPQLGYITLQQPLNNDEVLAVAFEYTIGGKVYKVGEFGTDGVDATVIGQDGDNQDIPTTQSLVLKMLKSTLASVNEPVWDLLMKNIYKIPNTSYLDKEGFRLNIMYTDPSPLNYISPVAGTTLPEDVANTPLLNVFNLDRLNSTDDPQNGGDGWFDYIANSPTSNNPSNNNNQGGGYNNQNPGLQNTNKFEGVTIDEENGRVIFTTVEPFGEHLFKKLSNNPAENYDVDASYNANQKKYVYKNLYRNTYTKALQESEKNKFQLKGKSSSSAGDGIPIGGFNLVPGSVVVTAGGRTLVEGVDYTVDYARGMVQILDPSLKESNTPIEISTEENSMFSQNRRSFFGVDVEHKVNDKLILGATYLRLSEQPLTVKSNYGDESVNNAIYGFNFNYSTDAPFLTRWVNKLPNIDTDVMSTLTFKGEFAYLKPGASKLDQINGEATSYIENFEGTQSNIDVLNPTMWFMSSVPVGFGENFTDLQSGYRRAKMSWYNIDQIFYSPYRRPNEITDGMLSSNKTRRIDKVELFPTMDIAQGELLTMNPLNLTYYPKERGPYNFNPQFLSNNELPNPQQNWAGIMRSIASTNFEQANVEYIEFWMMDPYTGNAGDVADLNNTGKVYFNLGYISEDILQDGMKQYENGLPTPANNAPTVSSVWGKVPASTALIYAFDTDANNRMYQDVGLDGLNDEEEKAKFSQFSSFADPAADNYEFFLTAQGDILSRYKNYNGLQGNTPIQFTDTNRGNTNLPDVEDIDNDNTMNTINAYYQYEVNVSPNPVIGENYVVDVRTTEVKFLNGNSTPVKWVQYKVPIIASEEYAVGAISDLQSIRFMRMFLTGFSDEITLRFGTLDLVRSDWRRYTESLVEDPNTIVQGTNTGFDVTTLNVLNNYARTPIPYVLPPGIVREQINQNNTIINQNEQALSLKVYKANSTVTPNGLEPDDSRAVFKNVGNIDMRQYKKLRMFLHAEALENVNDATRLKDDEMVAFIRFGNDFTDNFYQVEIPLKVTEWGTTIADEIWPLANEIELQLELLTKLKLMRNRDNTQDPNFIYFKNEEELAPELADKINKLRIGVKGNPNFGMLRTIMIGVRNNTRVLYENDVQSPRDLRGEVWFNELRMSDMTNKGGWAAVGTVDAKIADFASVTASVNKQTMGFGSIEQGPQERSREDVFQYNVATAVNAHQLLPKKWNLNIPFSYSVAEEKITPEYDPNDPDIRLQTKMDEAQTEQERRQIKDRAIEYTKRTSINFIGVNKQRSPNQKQHFYDIENITLSHSFNEVQQHNYEVERMLDQQASSSLDYSFGFKPWNIEPFKKAENFKKNKYLKLFSDFNLNLLPTSLTFRSNVLRQYNQQKYRMIDVEGIEIQPLYRRNYFFNYNYGVNFNLTKNLTLNYTASNNNVVRNFMDENRYVDNSLGIWDGYFDPGTPNLRMQSLQMTYKLPFDKIPFLAFINSDYSYSGDYSWQRATDAFSNIDYNGVNYELGNTIQNANTHRLNSTITMDVLYKYIGLVPSTAKQKKKTSSLEARPKPGEKVERNKELTAKEKKEEEEKGSAALDAAINFVTMVKKVGINYEESNGTVLPGYLGGLGFFGTSRPTLGYVFGSQEDVRYEAARKGWLTYYPEFNQEFSRMHTERLTFTAEVRPLKDLLITINANKNYSTNMSEQYDVENGIYNSRSPYESGFFSTSNIMIGTAFGKSDVNGSAAFEQFKANRILVANRLATERGIDLSDPANIDEYGYPVGYSRTNQEVLIPSFLAAYSGKDVSKQGNGFLKNIPLPNWNLRYTGLAKLGWFKDHFSNFTISHVYTSGYSVNNFQTNYEYLENPNGLNAGGNYPAKNVVSNITMNENFAPLVGIDFRTKSNIDFGVRINKDRLLSMSFDNNLLTEVQGNEYSFKFGFIIKDVGFTTNFEGVANGGRIVSDMRITTEFSWRRNQTIIRYLDYNNNQIGAGQDVTNIKVNASYDVSKNFTFIFYYEHMFSKAVISTMYPITNIRSGITLRYNFGN
ncbi:protein involved in gliding motility SprA [Paenimyroides aquimaris]|uniref:Protein involved in gliding motility SprA n=1 Tax=Paenimyroides marinum TaxID=1159016 RepID=A0A1H6LWV1_9FLAO|nr:cell surface protein SprA [Paenimyroides aquimaris]SEH89558.1 protein involved in gliding motility SprA [Paenimyroides aquimaris]